MEGKRQIIFEYLSAAIRAAKKDRPLRVAIDGVDAAGKTTLADELGKGLAAGGGKIIRASIDGFHNPRAVRYRRGRMSPEGYYRDSFNNQAVIDNLLAPLGPGGTRRCKTAVFDFRTDRAVAGDLTVATEDSILIMEGVFLLRPELNDFWDLKIFIDADFSSTLPRAVKRDRDYLGGEAAVIDAYKCRYIPGQEIYFKEADPKSAADIVVDNNNFDSPGIVKRSER